MSKRPAPRLRGFDLAKYIGSEERGIRPRYSAVELMILSSGTLGLMAAIACKSSKKARCVASAASDYNRRRFRDPVGSPLPYNGRDKRRRFANAREASRLKGRDRKGMELKGRDRNS